jgi:translation initiation factor IF-2
MQQRQLRLGDILDDYCPRERRVTNHVIVAMIAEDVKQVRCTTCDADHEYKHAKVPRQRRKTETPAALYAQVLAAGPKRVVHETPPSAAAAAEPSAPPVEEPAQISEPAIAAADHDEAHAAPADAGDTSDAEPDDDRGNRDEEEGPIHRRLIRASLPKIDGAPPPTRQIPEFTIRQPAGRPVNRFRQRGPRPGGGGQQQFQGNRSGGNTHHGHGGHRGGGMRQGGGGRPQGQGGGQARRHGPGGRRRPK